MTHTHIAGSIHADQAANAPSWLQAPADLGYVNPALWPVGTHRNDAGELVVGGAGVCELAAQYDTPLYIIDEADFRARAAGFRDAFDSWTVYYAGKSLLTRTIARWVAEEGLSLDVTTMGEMQIALSGGMPPQRLAFHGNNKSEHELRFAVEQGIGRFVVDSFTEIERLEAICQELGTTVRALVRVTTGVEAHTHEYIATAHEDQKFGLSIASGQALTALVRCHSSAEIELRGIHSHIGSQIFETHGFEVAIRRTMRLAQQFCTATGVQLPELDLGGGFGIAYTEADQPLAIEQLASAFKEMVALECRGFGLAEPHLSIEPGRAISGPAGVALYSVGTIKQVELEGGRGRVYVSVDGGMSDNIRPALYAAEYSAVLANRVSAAEPVLCRVVGKHCEGGDILIRDVFLPRDLQLGDLIAVPGAGAYARSMASNYNAIPKSPVISVRDGQSATLLRRETLDDMMRLDVGE